MATVRRVDLCFAIIFSCILSCVAGQNDGFKPNIRRDTDFGEQQPNPKFRGVDDVKRQENLVDTGDRVRADRGFRGGGDPNAGAPPVRYQPAKNEGLDPSFNRPPANQPIRPAFDGNDDRQFGNVANQGGLAARVGQNMQNLGKMANPANPGAVPLEKQQFGRAPDHAPVAPAGHGQSPALGGAPRRPPPIKISESPACKDDVKHYCSGSSASNNFAVLDCLQNNEKVCMVQLLPTNCLIKALNVYSLACWLPVPKTHQIMMYHGKPACIFQHLQYTFQYTLLLKLKYWAKFSVMLLQNLEFT